MNYNSKLWALRFVKQAGLKQDDLLLIYKSTLRPTLDFASVTFHSFLTAEQSLNIERLQARSSDESSLW